jgi:hypothetical protein
MVPFLLASGDSGVRSVQSVQLSISTGTAGNFGLTLLRRIAEIPINVTNMAQVHDAFALGMPRIYDSACLAMMVMCSTTNTGVMQGAVSLVQG